MTLLRREYDTLGGTLCSSAAAQARKMRFSAFMSGIFGVQLEGEMAEDMYSTGSRFVRGLEEGITRSCQVLGRDSLMAN